VNRNADSLGLGDTRFVIILLWRYLTIALQTSGWDSYSFEPVFGTFATQTPTKGYLSAIGSVKSSGIALRFSSSVRKPD
jgi:hypothetical protein